MFALPFTAWAPRKASAGLRRLCQFMYGGFRITCNLNFTGTFRDGRQTLGETFARLSGCGFDGVDFDTEWFIGSPDWREKGAEAAELAALHGLDVSFGHLPFHKLRGPDSLKECILDGIELASVIGMKRGVVHPKSTPERLDDLDFNFRKNIEWFSPLVEKAEKYGVKLLIENMPNYYADGRMRYGAQPEHIIALADALGCGNCWDTGHANLSEVDQYLGITALGDRLMGLHLNDDVGGHIDAHLIPGFGTADWDGVMRALYDIGYSGTFNFECRTRHLPKAASEFAGYHLMAVARSLIDRAWKK